MNVAIKFVNCVIILNIALFAINVWPVIALQTFTNKNVIISYVKNAKVLHSAEFVFLLIFVKLAQFILQKTMHFVNMVSA